jgi:hypothetical protein
MVGSKEWIKNHCGVGDALSGGVCLEHVGLIPSTANNKTKTKGRKE